MRLTPRDESQYDRIVTSIWRVGVDFTMALAEILQISLVAALVGVTIYYAIQNKGMRDEMKKEREIRTKEFNLNLKPVIVIDELSPEMTLSSGVEEGTMCCGPMLRLIIENVGFGRAINVDIDVSAVFKVELPSGYQDKRCFHFSTIPRNTTSLIWHQTIPNQSGPQQIAMYLNWEESPGTIDEGIRYQVTYTDILGNRIPPIIGNFIIGATCQEKLPDETKQVIWPSLKPLNTGQQRLY